MPTHNTVQKTGGAAAASAISTTPPVAGDPPQLWDNGGVLTYWNGAANQILDFNDGPNSSVFGTPLGDQ